MTPNERTRKLLTIWEQHVEDAHKRLHPGKTVKAKWLMNWASTHISCQTGDCQWTYTLKENA